MLGDQIDFVEVAGDPENLLHVPRDVLDVLDILGDEADHFIRIAQHVIDQYGRATEGVICGSHTHQAKPRSSSLWWEVANVALTKSRASTSEQMPSYVFRCS